MNKPRILPWNHPAPPPTEQEAEARLHQEGYDCIRWTDVSGVDYPRHRHEKDECLWILKGELILTVENQDYVLTPGDRLYLPANAPHTARVSGKSSVTYLVGQLRE